MQIQEPLLGFCCFAHKQKPRNKNPLKNRLSENRKVAWCKKCIRPGRFPCEVWVQIPEPLPFLPLFLMVCDPQMQPLRTRKRKQKANHDRQNQPESETKTQTQLIGDNNQNKSKNTNRPSQNTTNKDTKHKAHTV